MNAEQIAVQDGEEQVAASRHQGERSLLREYAEALLVAVILASFAKGFVVQPFTIPSGSMEHTLEIGDYILVNKFVYAPAGSEAESFLLPKRAIRRGDVVVFKYPLEPSRDFIKRCIGLPGDQVDLRDRLLFINDQEVPESYVQFNDPRVYRSRLEGKRWEADQFGPYVVPEGHYFCLGDSRSNSEDSRFWGPVPASNVKGRALLVYWSVEREEGLAVETLGLLQRFKRLGRALIRLPVDTHWRRIFRFVR